MVPFVNGFFLQEFVSTMDLLDEPVSDWHASTRNRFAGRASGYECPFKASVGAYMVMVEMLNRGYPIQLNQRQFNEATLIQPPGTVVRLLLQLVTKLELSCSDANGKIFTIGKAINHLISSVSLPCRKPFG